MDTTKLQTIDLAAPEDEDASGNRVREMPLSWYPVATSTSLKAGEKKVIQFCADEWVLFRANSDKLGVVSRYCKHMGADLSRGHVTGEHLRCPLHQWPYDVRGVCHAQIDEPLRRQAALKTLSVTECAGIIFLFPLAKPLFELPYPINDCTLSISRTRVLQLPIHFLAPALNTFDVAHYRNVHNREIMGEPTISSENPLHLSICFKAQVLKKRWQDRLMSAMGFNVVDISINCWGSNLLVMKNLSARVGAVVAATPTNVSNSTLYLAAFELASDIPARKTLINKIKLEASLAITIAFLKADVPVLTGMHPREGVLVPGQDDIAKKFWNYLRKLPTIDTRHEN